MNEIWLIALGAYILGAASFAAGVLLYEKIIVPRRAGRISMSAGHGLFPGDHVKVSGAHDAGGRPRNGIFEVKRVSSGGADLQPRRGA